jgi:hypothetical protein
VEDFQIVLVADRAFDQAQIHIFRIFLHVHDGAVNEVHGVGEINQKLIEVEERHVATGAAAQPNCG